MEKKDSFLKGKESFVPKKLDRFKRAHDDHYATLKHVEAVLSKYKIRFKKTVRGQGAGFDTYDLVITVGGDGTFLEAARNIQTSILLGVNSSTKFSVGNFCVANIHNFDVIIQRILQKNFNVRLLQRLRLDIEGQRTPIDCLNDVLVCHSNPAAMSRYVLKIGRIKEEQRNSGIWIATPAGSSGAIKSAGGKKIVNTAKKIQYMPRELYWGGNWRYRLTGGVLSARQKITIVSLMRQGKVYIDGTHLEIPFSLGATMIVALSPNPIKTIDV